MLMPHVYFHLSLLNVIYASEIVPYRSTAR